MKKIVIFGVVLAMILFFTLPTMIFAEPGDDSQAIGHEADGQYVVDPVDTDYADPPEAVPEPENDRMEVYCIDEDIEQDRTGPNYEETDINVSDELIATGEDPNDAVAVEIMATNPTGATNEDNQNVVWALLDSLTGTELVEPADLDPVETEVYDEVLALATEYNGLLSDLDPTNDPASLKDFIDSKEINDLDVYLNIDGIPFIEPDGTANNEFWAVAIMPEPLVPGVTDGATVADDLVDDNVLPVPPATGSKTVFWYIMEGSFNVSFNQNTLVTETTDLMYDYKDEADNWSTGDNDGDGEITGDHYGASAIPYFFYWWGDGFPEYEEMCVNLGVIVDIDDDGKVDLEQGPELDDFNNLANVVSVDSNGDVTKLPGQWLDSGMTIPAVTTYVPSNVDIDYYNAGKVLVRPCNNDEIDGTFEVSEINLRPSIPCYQRFVIESYNEEGNSAYECYSRWLDYNVNKTDSTDPDIKVEGATYKLTYAGGRTSPNSYPYETEFTSITDVNGVAAFTGLPWGFYDLTEEVAPAGYKMHVGSYPVGIGGDTFFEANQEELPENYGFIDVTNDPIGHHDNPIPEPEPEGTITVAALTTGVQVLAFTGIDPIIPISGAGVLIGGLGLLIASLKTRRNRKS